MLIHLRLELHRCPVERVSLDLFRGLSQKTVTSTKGEIWQSYLVVKNV